MADVPALIGDVTIATMVGNYYDKTWLERFEANLSYDKDGVQKPLPENSGNTVIWHQMLNPSRGYSLSDGTTNSASAVSTRKVSAIVAQYGDVKAISDNTDMLAVCPVVEEAVAALGYAAALTKNYVIADAIGFGSAASTGVADAASTKVPSVFTQGFPIIEGNTGTVYWAATGLLNGLFSTLPTIAHIRKSVTVLKGLNAMPFEDGNFRGIIDPVVSDAIRTDTSFATWMAYTNRAAMEKGKLAVIEKVLFEESTEAIAIAVAASAWSNSAYVSVAGGKTLHGTLIFGKGAYGVTKLGGKDAKVNVISGAEKSDPNNQRTYIAYKFTMAAKILNPSAGIILTYFA
jgi:N4-gp56 family major capsid protein